MSAKPKLLIVEDDEGLSSQYRWAFMSCEILLSRTREKAVAPARQERPPVAIMDLGLPPDPHGVSEGLATLEEVSRISPRTRVIIVTCHDAGRVASRALNLGAYDFCEKPVGIDVLRSIVDRALGPDWPNGNNHRLDTAMLNVRHYVEQRAMARMPALMLNKSGARGGPAAVARETHKNAVHL